MAVHCSSIVGPENWNENGEMNEAKRRCINFSVREKLKYIKRLDRGETTNSIARELGLSPATVGRWRHNRCEFKRFDDIENRKRRRRGTMVAHPMLDVDVYIWFEQQMAQSVVVSSTTLKAKAIELNEKLGGDRRFNANDDWLRRWKIRHGISRGITDDDEGGVVIIEKTSKIPLSSISFEEKLSQILTKKMNLTSSQIFNIAVTTLCYKSLPIKSSKSGKIGWLMQQERVTVMTCSNADSTLKLRLLVIGKSAQPRGLKNVKNLSIPVYYANHDNATINSRLFTDWFVNEFVPRVKEFFADKTIPPSAILLLDDTDPSSPDLAIGDIKTMLVPSNETLTLSTSKHRVTENLKRRYRQGLLESASNAQDKGHDPLRHVKILGMKDIVFRLDDAWTEVTRQTIVDSWNNLVTPLVPIERDPLAIDEQPEENVILRLVRKIAGNDDITENEVDEWIMDKEPLRKTSNIVNAEKNVNYKNNDSGNDVITADQAVEALDSVIRFFERHGRLSQVELAALRKAREGALAEKTKDSVIK